jgi:transglutaminase-like putative cysteine protease
VGFALARFGGLPTGLPRVRAICSYVWQHVLYVSETSDSTTDAVDTLLAAQGVCRDFAHLVAALCRAVGVPARIASVYAPGLSPMDFHAVVETEIDGHWRVWDATRSAPRQVMVRIATGRDAADTAFVSVLDGRAELTSIQIVAITDGDLPEDDHDALITLG